MDNIKENYQYECVNEVDLKIVNPVDLKTGYSQFQDGRMYNKEVVEKLLPATIKMYFKKVSIPTPMDKIIALNQNIIVKKIIEQQALSKSGLILTQDDEIDNRYHKGTIIKVGQMLQSQLKEGSIIYYDKMAGFDIRLNGELYTIIKEANAQLVVEE